MINKNPNVVIMLNESINYDSFVVNMKSDWNYNCKYHILEQQNFTSYSFSYDNIQFICSEFTTKFPEDIEGEVEESLYGDELEEIYKEHTKFLVISVTDNSKEDLIQVYTYFTRVVMSMLRACEKSLIYDVRSRLVFQSDIYLTMYDQMQLWYQKNKSIFPINLYVNIQVYSENNKISAFTLGFEAFNNYEIEIHNKSIEYNEILSIMKFIVSKVVSTHDEIKNKDIIPVPFNGGYREAIVKQFNSEILNKEALAIVF